MAISNNRLHGMSIFGAGGLVTDIGTRAEKSSENLAEDGLPIGEREDGFYYLKSGRFRINNCDFYGPAQKTFFTVEDSQFKEINFDDITLILSSEGHRLYLKEQSWWTFLKAKLGVNKDELSEH